MSEVLEQSRADLIAAIDQEMEDIRVFYRAREAQLEAQITAQTERANKAEKELAECRDEDDEEPEEPEEPNDTSQVFGTSYGGGDESFNNGNARVARLFWNGEVMPNSIRTDKFFKQAYDEGVRVFVLSWKSHNDAEVEDFLDDLPKDCTFYGCHHHEIENDCKPGDATHKKFRETTKRHYAIMRKHNVIPVQIFMQYTLTKGSGRKLLDWFVEGCEGVMYDAYINPKKGKDDPEGMADRMEAATKGLPGVKFSGLGEHGVPNADNTESVIFALVTRMRNRLVKSKFFRLNCYWPSRGFEFPSQRVADVWHGVKSK